MHPELVREIVKVCRQREREGDCPTVPEFTVEHLENCIISLADQLLIAVAPDEECEAGVLHQDAPNTKTRTKTMHDPMSEDMAAQMKPAEAAIRARAVNGRITGTTSFVQRTLQCGYNRAAAILDVMVARGIISEPDRNGARHLKSQ